MGSAGRAGASRAGASRAGASRAGASSRPCVHRFFTSGL